MKGKSGKSLATTLIGFVLVWVLIPVCLYFVGFKLVGPTIGKVPALSSQAQKVEELISKPATGGHSRVVSEPQDDQEADTPDSTHTPLVDISVAKATGKAKPGRNSTATETPRHKKKKKAKQASVAPSTRDEASGDGAMPDSGGERSADPAGGG